MFRLKQFSIALLSLMIVLTARADSSEMKAAKQYIYTINQQAAQPIEPLPTFVEPQPYLYSAGAMRSPFDVPRPQTNSSENAPDMNRPKEFLESYALDSLHMVGTLEKDGQTWALISTPNNMIYRVKIGSHMGENYGEVTAISNSQVDLQETVPNGVGGWSKRFVSLSLSTDAQNGSRNNGPAS